MSILLAKITVVFGVLLKEDCTRLTSTLVQLGMRVKEKQRQTFASAFNTAVFEDTGGTMLQVRTSVKKMLSRKSG